MFRTLKPPLSARLIPGHPLANGLVGCWLMNEGSGRKIFNLVNYGSSNGIFTVVGANYTTWQATSMGIATHYDDNEEWIDCGSNIANIIDFTVDEFTIEGYGYLTSKGIDRDFLSIYKEGGANRAIELRYDVGDDYWEFNCYDNNWQYAKFSQSHTELNKWVHLVGLRRGNTFEIWVDGIKGATTDTIGTIVTGGSPEIVIGNLNHSSGYRQWLGDILYARIWDHALTPSEIQSLYINPYAMFEPEPIWLMVHGAAAGGVEVSAATDALILTEYTATINAEISISAEVDALILTEYSATIALDVSVSASVDALILTEHSATINAEISISAGIDALILTEHAATVSVGEDILVEAGIDSLTLTEYSATVNAEISFTATVDALILTEYAVDVNLNVNVSCGLDTLILTEYATTVNAEIMIAAGLDTLILSEYIANIVVTTAWTNITIQGIDAISGEPIYIIGKYK